MRLRIDHVVYNSKEVRSVFLITPFPNNTLRYSGKVSDNDHGVGVILNTNPIITKVLYKADSLGEAEMAMEHYSEKLFGDSIGEFKPNDLLSNEINREDKMKALIQHAVGPMLQSCGNSYANAYITSWLDLAKEVDAYHGKTIGRIANLEEELESSTDCKELDAIKDSNND